MEVGISCFIYRYLKLLTAFKRVPDKVQRFVQIVQLRIV